MTRVLALLAFAVLAGCAMPGPVIWVPAQAGPVTCPTETVGRWWYSKEEQKWFCVLRAYQPAVVYQPYVVVGPPTYYSQFGWWGVVVEVRSGGYYRW